MLNFPAKPGHHFAGGLLRCLTLRPTSGLTICLAGGLLTGSLLLTGCGASSSGRASLPPPPAPPALLPGTGILSHEYEEKEAPPRMIRVASLPLGSTSKQAQASRKQTQPAGSSPEPHTADAPVLTPALTAIHEAHVANMAPAPEEWRKLAREAEEIFGLDAELVLAVIRAESSFNHEAQSSAGAQGAMQIMPGTQEELGLIDPFDPRANVYAGSQYLMHQLQRFGSVELALAAYNAGPESVERYGGIPPFAETQEFVRRVLAYWKCGLPATKSKQTP